MRDGVWCHGVINQTRSLRVLNLRLRHTQRFYSTHSTGSKGEEKPIEADLGDLGRVIKDDFARFQQQYEVPKYPIVLAHGLMGFDELRLFGQLLPGVQYWRGIKEAYHKNGIEVITTRVPTTGSIVQRAEALHNSIKQAAYGKQINIVAHSMGGLDARYLISHIKPTEFEVKSLTTIATPHRGSSAADIVFREIGTANIATIFKLLARLQIESGAFEQLTRKYVQEQFNSHHPDDPNVSYFSYGASARPNILSVFRVSHDLVEVLEGPNDGLVSVSSSKWGSYQGTLMGVTHLDLINWTNRIKRFVAHMGLMKQDFDAVAFYLAVADMLAREGF